MPPSKLLHVSVILAMLCWAGECNKYAKSIPYTAISCRKHSAVITEFGGIGDGKTSNTKAFQSAINNLSRYASDGGAQLIVPPGKWLIGPFNLTSHFTLFLHKDALLLASQDGAEWPLLPPLPSYGRGRDALGGRFGSFIFGTNLTDVVITGITIIAPIDSPNTDGINPDSCTNTRIQDSYIVSGDDCIAVKSGWDQYGIKFNMPTTHLLIRRITCISPDSAAIALGSEMSGGIEDVRAEDITAVNTESAIRIKTAPGRGAYVRNIFARRFTLHTMKYVFWMTGAYGSHPDKGYDPNALPNITGINYRDMVAENVTVSGKLEGIEKDPFTGICVSNVSIGLTVKPKKMQWDCKDVKGVSRNVSPQPCELLGGETLDCVFPRDKLPVEDVEMKSCYVG